MKRLITTILLLFSLQAITAQSKKIELFDLVRMLSPDATQASKELSWNTSAEINSYVKWESSLPKKYGESFSKNGTANILLNGKPFTCEDRIGGSKHPCKWSISLSGSKAGYSSFSINTYDFPIDEPKQAIDFLFKKNNSSFTLLKKCIEGAIAWDDLYKVTIPGKKNTLLIIEYLSTSATGAQYENNKMENTFSVTFHFDKKEVESQCEISLPENFSENTSGLNEPVNKDSKKQVAAERQVPLSPAAKIIFRFTKTKLTNAEKNFFADGFVTEIRKEYGDTVLLQQEDNGETIPSPAYVYILPADLNKDGVDEIFMQISGSFYGPDIQDFSLYIKDNTGKYVAQPGVSSPDFCERITSNGGYPDLIGGPGGGPGMDYKPATRFDVYRWNGKQYTVIKKNQPHVKTDKLLNDAYSLTIGANPVDYTSGEPTTTKVAKQVSSLAAKNTSSLTPIAAMLFANVKSKLTDAEKNDLIQKTGITPEDTVRTKKGKPKTKFTIYPMDLNNDGKEEIFLCVTTSPIGIPLNNYFFYAKDNNGSYQPMPGKVGQGARILLNGKAGYPDLIIGVPGLTRELWSWNGNTYRLVQSINGNVNIPYKTKDIDNASAEYTGKQ